MHRKKADRLTSPLTEAFNIVRSHADRPVQLLNADVRVRLRDACLLLLSQPAESLDPVRSGLATKARNIINDVMDVVPGVPRSALKAHGTLVRDDLPKHGRRALLIKHWHGEYKDVLGPYALTGLEHLRAAGGALGVVQKAATDHRNGTHFLFEMLSFAASETENPLRRDMHQLRGNMTQIYDRLRTMPIPELVTYLREQYAKQKDNDEWLEQIFYRLQPMIPLMSWLLEDANSHLHLPGRPAERINPWGKFDERMQQLARALQDPREAELVEARERFTASTVEDEYVRHTFVRERCLTVPDSGNVTILYGGAHIRAGIQTNDYTTHLDEMLQDRFDVTVLEPHRYSDLALAAAPSPDKWSDQQLRAYILELRKRMGTGPASRRLQIGDLSQE